MDSIILDQVRKIILKVHEKLPQVKVF